MPEVRGLAGGERQKGLSLVEILIVLAAYALLLVPTVAVFHRYNQVLLLDTACREVVATLQLARQLALEERKTVQVIFETECFTVYQAGKELLDKRRRLPEHVAFEEKTSGFSPVVFCPDGTAREAGHLVLREERSGKRKKIILYNLTGKCVVE